MFQTTNQSLSLPSCSPNISEFNCFCHALSSCICADSFQGMMVYPRAARANLECKASLDIPSRKLTYGKWAIYSSFLLLKIAISHSHVKLPKGTLIQKLLKGCSSRFFLCIHPMKTPSTKKC